MHSTLVRAQNLFGFFTTTAFVLSSLVAFSVLLSPQTPSADLSLRDVQVVKGRPHYYSTKKEQYAHIRFDLDADLTTLFNWNTKQVFVWVLATWPATTTITTTSSDLSSAAAPPNSSAVIWDTIIPCAPSPSRAYLASLISTYIDSFTSYTVPGSGKSSSSSKAKSKRSKSPPKSKASTSSSSSSSTTAHASKPGLLRLSNHRGKYQITDVSGKLAGVGNATLEIGWNVQPWVGALLWTSQTSQSQPWWLEAPTSLLHKLGPWKKLRGGRSEAWSFPELKGAPKPVSTPSSEQANNP